MYDGTMNKKIGEAARDAAIARVAAHANVSWMHAATCLVEIFAASKQPFTACDILTELDRLIADKKVYLPEKTHDNRALGAVFMAASKREQIKRTGAIASSKIARQHRRPQTVWKGC